MLHNLQPNMRKIIYSIWILWFNLIFSAQFCPHCVNLHAFSNKGVSKGGLTMGQIFSSPFFCKIPASRSSCIKHIWSNCILEGKILALWDPGPYWVGFQSHWPTKDWREKQLKVLHRRFEETLWEERLEFKSKEGVQEQGTWIKATKQKCFRRPR